MGRAEVEEQTRHSVVPASARRSPWAAAVWTGLGSAVVCMVAAIVAVTVCWLPTSSQGHTSSAIKGGLLTLLASLHGGLTVDGVATHWLPLGMLVIVGVTAWRAGSGLADAAEAMDERDPLRLALAGLTQALTFTVAALVAVPFATLGTSRAPVVGVGLAAFVLFALTGGTAFVRSSALRTEIATRVPASTGLVLRAGAAAVATYLLAGALLAAGSLVVHHARAEQLSAQLGGGIGGLSVVLLGVLAAPNAAIAAVAYLAGPGFAIGSGTTFGLFGTAHGVVPSFPLLAALPTGTRPNTVVWALAALTPVLAGAVVVRLCLRAEGWARRFATAGCAAVAAALIMFVLTWQGGGAVGDGRLATVGGSPWQVAGMVGAAVLFVSCGLLSVGLAWTIVRGNDLEDEEDEEPLLPRRAPRMVVVPTAAPEDDAEDGAGVTPAGDADKDDPLAG